MIPEKQIRAHYDAQTISVYQAYSHTIADAALQAGTFQSPPFKMGRMTWIKPSFLWMMYRAGWGHKDAGQNRIFTIDIKREGFEWALQNSCSSHPPKDMSKEDWLAYKASKPVRIQWDPERDIHIQPLPYRSIQIGLTGEAVPKYINDWIVKLTDITALAHEIHNLVAQGKTEQATSLLPSEKNYPYS